LGAAWILSYGVNGKAEEAEISRQTFRESQTISGLIGRMGKKQWVKRVILG